MSDAIRSYPSIFNLGHAAIAGLFDGDVVIQEKVDGSQFSFARRGDVMACRSKGKQIVVDEPEKMFVGACETVKAIAPLLIDGATYRGEYLQSPRHNTLGYSRVPTQYIILYDVDTGMDAYASPEFVGAEAARLGLECVPTFYVGPVATFDEFVALTERESCLGGAKMEGVVVKNYARFGIDKRPLMGKYVRPEFREEHKAAWKVGNPSAGDVIDRVIATYKTEARWRKAVQHARDAGQLEGSPRDIPVLIREVPADVLKECEGEIRRELWAWAWPKIERGLRGGLPEWYKDELARGAFEVPA